jgi:hypothetical protein
LSFRKHCEVKWAFDTSGAMEAIGFGMTVALTFAALWNGSFWSRWFKFDFCIM